MVLYSNNDNITGCHDYLISMDSEVVLNASSIAPSRNSYVYSVNQGKISSKSLMTQNGLLIGAWVPASSATDQWIQVSIGASQWIQVSIGASQWIQASISDVAIRRIVD